MKHALITHASHELGPTRRLNVYIVDADNAQTIEVAGDYKI